MNSIRDCDRDCGRCPAFERECEGCLDPCRFSRCDGVCGQCPVRCGRHEDLQGRLAAIGGLSLDVPLRPQSPFDLPLFFPQLINGLAIPDLLGRERAFAVGIEKVLTPRGEVSRRAIPHEFGTHSLRAQWGIGDDTRLICVGNARDDHLERLWNAQAETDVWGRMVALGFNAATSLNFSVYLDDPRLEHLINVKRTWLTVRRLQETSSLIPIPHLQWATLRDLERQLDYAQAQGFHTLTLNLQMVKRQGWDTVAQGLALIRERALDLRLLFAGVAGLKRMAELARFFPDRARVAFTNASTHYLAEHYLRLRRAGAGPVDGSLKDRPDLTRLIKEPVTGHPDRILLDNVRVYRGFLGEIYGRESTRPQPGSAEMNRHVDAVGKVRSALTSRLSFSEPEASAWADRLAVDDGILYAFLDWLRSGRVDRDFGGSFPRWPGADRLPHPTLGELLGGGKSPLEAFLHLADLAQQAYDEIEAQVGLAGH